MNNTQIKPYVRSRVAALHMFARLLEVQTVTGFVEIKPYPLRKDC